MKIICRILLILFYSDNIILNENNFKNNNKYENNFEKRNCNHIALCFLGVFIDRYAFQNLEVILVKEVVQSIISESSLLY